MMFAFQHDSFTDLTPLKNWNPSSLKDLALAFQDCKNLENLDGLENWDVSNLQTLESTFKDCVSLKNIDGLANWNTENLRKLMQTFYGCTSLEAADSLAQWNTEQVTTYDHMLANCSNLASVDLSGWDTTKVSNPYFYSMFSGDSQLSRITFGENFTANTSSLGIPTPSRDAQYTGNWVRENGDDPTSAYRLMTLNAHNATTPETRAGTWVWEQHTYLVHFDPNGGSGSMADQAFHGVEQALSPNMFTKFGSTFAGWNTKPDGSGDSYTDEQEASFTKETTLYAQWASSQTEVAMKDGSFTVTLQAGQTALIDDLPAGTTYKVYEETPSGWVLVTSSDASGTVPPADKANAQFVNEYRPGETSANIVATKTIDGMIPGEGQFSFTLTGMNNAPMPTGASATNADGTSTVVVSNAGGALSTSALSHMQRQGSISTPLRKIFLMMR